MTRPRALLISANTETVPTPVYPTALAYLSGAAREAGWEPLQYDLAIDGLQGLCRSIQDAGPSLVALSIRNIDNTDSASRKAYGGDYAALARAIRAATDAPLIIGGAGVSIFPEKMLELTGADYAVVGAGEGPFRDILERVAGTAEPLAQLPSVIAPTHSSPAAAFLPPLHDERLVKHYWKTAGVIGIQTKRGCPRHCSYCTYPLIEGREVAFRDPGAVVDELEQLVGDHGVNYFFFVDSVFNLDADHETEVAHEILRRGLDISWGALFSPMGLTADYLEIMKRSGLTHVELGADSFCDAMLESYRKGFSAGEAVDAALACLRLGIHCAVYLIFGGRGETPSTITATAERASQLEQAVFFPFAGLRVYPGTDIHEHACRSGLIEPGEDCFEPRFFFEKGLDAAVIWGTLENTLGNQGNWVLPQNYSKYRPAISLLRQLGHKGPLWEHVVAANARRLPRECAVDGEAARG